MKPILYSKDGASRIGVLEEALSALVTEELNGEFTASFTYPYVGEFFSQIDFDSTVRIKPNPQKEYQPFLVTGIGKNINGMITYNLEHISYNLNKNPIMVVRKNEGTAKEILNEVLNSAIMENHYVGESDIETVKTCELDFMSAREAIFKIQQYFGGELEWDSNSRVILHKERGKDEGTAISYGVNLIDYTKKSDISNLYTAIAPYMQITDENNDKTTYTLPEKILKYYNADNYAYIRAKPIDFTDEFTDEELENLTSESAIVSELRNKALTYMQDNFLTDISRNVTLSYVDLSKAKEFAAIEKMNTLGLCDYVTLKDDRLGVNYKAKVISVKFNAITEMYDSIEIGNPTQQLLDSLASIVNFNSDKTVGEAVDEIEKNLDEYFSSIDVSDNKITFTSGNIKNMEGVYNKYTYILSRDTDIQEQGKKGRIISFTDPKNRKTRIIRKE